MPDAQSNEDLTDISAKAEELLSWIQDNSESRSSEHLELENAILTPGHFVELAISATQRQRSSLESVKFNQGEIVITYVLYPGNKFATPCTSVINMSSIMGWRGDGNTIEIVFPEEIHSVTIGETNAYGERHPNKVVQIVRMLGQHGIRFIP